MPLEIPPKYTRNVWFTEHEEDHGLSLRHKGDKLFDKQSDFQRVVLDNTYKFGKMLTLDGAIMTTRMMNTFTRDDHAPSPSVDR